MDTRLSDSVPCKEYELRDWGKVRLLQCWLTRLDNSENVFNSLNVICILMLMMVYANQNDVCQRGKRQPTDNAKV